MHIINLPIDSPSRKELMRITSRSLIGVIGTERSACQISTEARVCIHYILDPEKSSSVWLNNQF